MLCYNGQEMVSKSHTRIWLSFISEILWDQVFIGGFRIFQQCILIRSCDSLTTILYVAVCCPTCSARNLPYGVCLFTSSCASHNLFQAVHCLHNLYQAVGYWLSSHALVDNHCSQTPNTVPKSHMLWTLVCGSHHLHGKLGSWRNG